MSLLKRNIIANYGGNIWVSILSLAVVPFYLKFLGIESFGLVGFFATLQSIFALLDMGMSTTINREIAIAAEHSSRPTYIHRMVKTFEILYWSIAIVIGIIIALLSKMIAEQWLNPKGLTIDEVRNALCIMGFAITFRFPIALYSGGLFGLQKHVVLNKAKIAFETLRFGGALVVLWFISSSVIAFFVWQMIASACQSFGMAILLKSNLPKLPGRTKFDINIVRGIWKFASGVMGITLFSTLLTQTDKIIASKLLSLEMFGYYSLASTLASGLFQLITPIFTACYPRFSQLIAQNDLRGLKSLYHSACQLMSVIIMPVAIIIAFYSKQVLFLWTQNSLTAVKTATILSLLIIGTMFNGLMNIPYALQLSYGWTSLALYSNVVSIIIFIPLVYFMASMYGAAGAASGWIILNLGYLTLNIPIMHRRLLKDQKMHWYAKDVGLPLIGCLAINTFWCFFLPDITSAISTFLFLSFLSVQSIAITTLCAESIRYNVISTFRTFFGNNRKF